MPHSDRIFGFQECVLDSVSSMLAYWDRDLCCRYANRAYERWFGVSPESLIGTSIRDLLGPALYALNEPHILSALEGHEQTFERAVPGPTGIRHSIARYTPNFQDGRVVGFVVEVTDVTSLKDAEAALRAEIAQHRHVLEQLRKREVALDVAQRLGKIGSWYWEIEADIISWSGELYRIFGLDPTRLPPPLAQHETMYAPASWASITRLIDSAIRDGTPYVVELEYLRPTGGWGWIEARGQIERDAEGVVVGLHGTAQEITERRQLTRLLEQRYSRISLATEAARLGIWSWNVHDDSVVWESRQPHHELLGLLEGEHLAECRRWMDLIDGDDLDSLQSALREFVERQGEFRFLGRGKRANDGGSRWMELAGRTEVVDRVGAHVIGTITDVTARVDQTNTLNRRIAELTDIDGRRADFIAVLAHELRNFLTPLSIGLAVVTRTTTSRDRTARMHDVMTRQVAYMGRLVDDLFDLRKVITGEFTIQRDLVPLQQVLDVAVETCGPAMEKAGHRLVVEGSTGLSVFGDEMRLTQLLCNLLNNSVKFTPAGGRIVVTIACRDPGFVTLTVTDDGIGMSEAAVRSVFGLFVRGSGGDDVNRSAGLGVGLHLVKHIAEAHGGHVRATSPGPGLGSSFRVVLPLARG